MIQFRVRHKQFNQSGTLSDSVIWMPFSLQANVKITYANGASPESALAAPSLFEISRLISPGSKQDLDAGQSQPRL